FQLLLADLALQLADPLARRRNILARLNIKPAKTLARPAGRPQRVRTTAAEVLAPLVQMPRRYSKLVGQCAHTLPRSTPLHRRELELPAEHSALALGHRPLLENCPLFLCLIFGVHSTVGKSDGAAAGLSRPLARSSKIFSRPLASATNLQGPACSMENPNAI